MPTHAWAIVLLCVAGAPLAGCGNACVDLATKICKCAPTEAERADCEDRVESRKLAENASSAQRERCAELDSTCSCAALAAGDLAACGLARDSGLSAPEAAGGR